MLQFFNITGKSLKIGLPDDKITLD